MVSRSGFDIFIDERIAAAQAEIASSRSRSWAFYEWAWRVHRVWLFG